MSDVSSKKLKSETPSNEIESRNHSKLFATSHHHIGERFIASSGLGPHFVQETEIMSIRYRPSGHDAGWPIHVIRTHK